MKIYLILAALLISAPTFAKIVRQGDQLFVESKGKLSPLGMLNVLIQNKEVSKVKLYDDGQLHLVSFAKGPEKEKLYSVDERGYTYAIKPYADYQVEKVLSDKVEFKERPGRTFKITSSGLFQ
jgi:hypothetical protein